MEEAFEAHRQPHEHSRITGYYASANLGDSAVYSQSQSIDLTTGLPKTNEPLRYYKVEMPQATRSPMKLCDHAMRHLGNPAIVAEIAAEYWRPTPGKWAYFEYVGPTMTILEEVPIPDVFKVSTSSNNYTTDHMNANHRWPLPKKA